MDIFLWMFRFWMALILGTAGLLIVLYLIAVILDAGHWLLSLRKPRRS